MHMKDLKLIESIVINQGRIITYDEIKLYLKDYKDINKKISGLIDKGLLVNLRKGVYFVSKIGSLGYTSISNYMIANAIGQESFVSFEAALKYHGLFDQGLKKYRSISKKQYLDKKLEGVVYEFIKVKQDSYFGFDSEKVDGGLARIAAKERALLDLIEYKRSINNLSLVLEKFSVYDQEIDFALMQKYLKNYSQVTLKICGFLMDLIGKDSADLEAMVNKESTSKMLDSSNTFSNKWRLYYDAILEEI